MFLDLRLLLGRSGGDQVGSFGGLVHELLIENVILGMKKDDGDSVRCLNSTGILVLKIGPSICTFIFHLACRQPVEDLGSIHLRANTAFDQGGPKLPELYVRYSLAPQMFLIFFRTLKVL